MEEAKTSFVTENGQKYLVQLCKHFAHKIEVEQADDRGELRFSCGTAYLNADGEALRIHVRAPDPVQLSQTQSVVESHLLRFAFREPAGPLAWQAAGG